MNVIAASARLLAQAGYTAGVIDVGGRPTLAFESSNVLGFLIVYETAAELVIGSENDVSTILDHFQLALRRSGQKAWNTYAVLLTARAADQHETVAFAAIEEDLRGTRKIAQGSIVDHAALRDALLPLLPLQSPPLLDEVDIATEIRVRATELSEREVDAFLSTATEPFVLQLLEEVA